MSKQKIWQVGSSSLHPLVENYTVGEDFELDLVLLPYDIQASKAHAKMLMSMKVITQEEYQQAVTGLNEIQTKWENNEFAIEKSQEDGHTAIEQYLTQYYGEVGKKIHTGRSRNDQSLVMMRLFMKEKVKEVQSQTQQLVKVLSQQIELYKDVAMPGYTHLQRAMPTTVGLWLGSFRDAFSDFSHYLDSTLQYIDQNPLGSASGFGISNFKMKREITTQELGFCKTQDNPLYCGLSRGYFENIVLQALSQSMILAAKFAHDMLIFTTQEFDFFALPDHFTTGSSIMPQKRNYDVFEIMRGNIKVFTAYQNEIQGVVSTIGSGYQRDLQLTKKPFVCGITLCLDTISLLTEIIPSLVVKQDNLETAMGEELFLTHKVYDLVNDGWSFREAYAQVKKQWLDT